jgi:hypothetical protein
MLRLCIAGSADSQLPLAAGFALFCSVLTRAAIDETKGVVVGQGLFIFPLLQSLVKIAFTVMGDGWRGFASFVLHILVSSCCKCLDKARGLMYYCIMYS